MTPHGLAALLIGSLLFGPPGFKKRQDPLVGTWQQTHSPRLFVDRTQSLAMTVRRDGSFIHSTLTRTPKKSWRYTYHGSWQRRGSRVLLRVQRIDYSESGFTIAERRRTREAFERGHRSLLATINRAFARNVITVSGNEMTWRFQGGSYQYRRVRAHGSGSSAGSGREDGPSVAEGVNAGTVRPRASD